MAIYPITSDEKLKLYMKLKIQIKGLEEEAKELVPEIIDSMQSDDLDKINSPMGSLSLSIRKMYKFSDKVVDAEKNIKKLKSEEIAEGTASVEEFPMLKFTVKKA